MNNIYKYFGINVAALKTGKKCNSKQQFINEQDI